MKLETQHTYEKIILGLELAGFLLLLSILWLDEYVDLPFRFLGAVKTPLRPQEFWFEATALLLVGIGVVVATLWVFRRLRYLEGLLEICAWCRKVKLHGEWVSVEQYLRLEHDLQSTHGICPECRADPATRRLPSVANVAA